MNSVLLPSVLPSPEAPSGHYATPDDGAIGGEGRRGKINSEKQFDTPPRLSVVDTKTINNPQKPK